MPETPKKHAYMVAALFGTPPEGRIFLQAVIAPSSEAATAMAIAQFIQSEQLTLPLQGVNVQMLTDEFLDAARRGVAGPAPVVQLRSVETAEVPQPYLPLDER